MPPSATPPPPGPTTRDPREEEILARPVAPCLTIAYHPDVARIGDISVLAGLLRGKDVKVTRTEPQFGRPDADPDEVPPAPLDDEHVSAGRALRIKRGADGGLVLEPAPDLRPEEVEVNGQPLTGRLALAPDAVEDGCVVMLGRSVVLVLHHVRLPLLAHEERGELDEAARRAFAAVEPLIGWNERMLDLKRKIRAVAVRADSVLVQGPTGSGKELVARAIHGASPRHQGPFMSVNMGGLIPGRAMGELFGWRKGAFAEAHRDTPGYITLAHGGVLFLDELGLAPVEARGGLLRFLETHEVWPLGADKCEKSDARLVAATDTDLHVAVRAGSFPRALLERLRQFDLRLPALRERRDDIGRLLLHFLKRHLADKSGTRAGGLPEQLRYRGDGVPLWLPASFVARLVRYSWPGNIRQLENLVRQIVVLSAKSKRAQIEDANIERLLAEDDPAPAHAPGVPTPPSSVPAIATGKRRLPSAISCDDLVVTLRETKWNISAAARRLGMSRTSFHKRVHECPQLGTAMELAPAVLEAARRKHAGDLVAMADELGVAAYALKLRLTKRDGVDVGADG